MENFPSALVIASYDSVCHNNNVLHRLVRPLADGSGVQSTDRLVNVVPFRRKYTFEKKVQVTEFGQEILRRPLVLQPVLHFGRGLGNYCSTCYQDELWLVMVNQTHPKILSRLQMGLDSAKLAIERGQPFEIKFRFGKLIQRVYKEHLAQKEREEAQTSSKSFLKYLTYFRYAEWEYCDLNLRYHGYGSSLNRASALQSLPSLEMNWDFEDIGMHEMVWSQLNDQVYPHAHMSTVSEDEIRQLLPGWTINGVSPLENIGDSIPEYSYDYAQAGRLYASFRKKKEPRNRLQQQVVSETSSNAINHGDNSHTDDEFCEERLGAVSFDPSSQYANINPHHVASEHNFKYLDINKPKQPSKSRQRYQDPDSPNDDQEHYQNIKQSSNQNILQYPYGDVLDSESDFRCSQADCEETFSSQSPMAIPQPDKHGHVYSNVQVISHKTEPHQNRTQASISTSHYVKQDTRSYVMHNPSNHHSYAGSLQKHDSDRSSKSTIADSGYCAEGDSDRSRGGSYDCNEHSYIPRHKQDHVGYENVSTNVENDEGGLVNPAFSMNNHDTNHIIRNSKQPESKFINAKLSGHTSKRPTVSASDHFSGYSNKITKSPYVLSPKDVVTAPPRQKRVGSASSTPQVAESFI